MDLHATLSANLKAVRERIAAACARVNRDPSEVTLIAVTKYHGADIADAIVNAGATEIGENRLQVAAPKFEAMKTKPKRHFIGPLQKNKVRDVLSLFDCIHSIDRMSIAEAIQSRAEQLEIASVPCFVEVNVSGEEQKGGFAPAQLFPALREMAATLDRVNLVGLMTMAPLSENAEATRPFFKRLRILRDNAVAEGFIAAPFGGLSMGMSGDFEVAVEEGATHVRVGTALYQGMEEA